MIRLALVDDHRVVRRGLRSYLQAFPDITVVGEASNGEQALRLAPTWQADVLLLDLLMPGGIDGIETMRRVRTLAPQMHIVALTAYSDDARVIAALRAGAMGYVRKDAEPELLLAAVRAAARGQSLLDPAVAAAVLRDMVNNDDVLTERELDVLRLMAHGYTNPQIAETLVVGNETIKTHVGNILTKLGQAHRTQAVVCGLKQGLISLDEIKL